MDIADQLGEMPKRKDVPTEKISYIRHKKQRGEDNVTDKGLRFDIDVPVGVIEIRHPALSGADADDYEPIDVKISDKLAQRPGSFVVLDKCLAGVSLLAGMLVDKFSYHRVP